MSLQNRQQGFCDNFSLYIFFRAIHIKKNIFCCLLRESRKKQWVTNEIWKIERFSSFSSLLMLSESFERFSSGIIHNIFFHHHHLCVLRSSFSLLGIRSVWVLLFCFSQVYFLCTFSWHFSSHDKFNLFERFFAAVVAAARLVRQREINIVR